MKTREEQRFSVSKRLTVLLTVVVVFAVVFVCPIAMASEGGAQPTTEPFTFDAFKRDLALWNLIIFTIVCIILAKFAFVPIAKALDQREQSVADNISSAERANSDAKALLEAYQKRLADADEEVRLIIENGKKDAERISNSIQEKAREAAQGEHERAVKDIESATTNAMRELAAKSATLATELAGKIIRADLNTEKHSSMIEAALQQFNTKS